MFTVTPLVGVAETRSGCEDVAVRNGSLLKGIVIWTGDETTLVLEVTVRTLGEGSPFTASSFVASGLDAGSLACSAAGFVAAGLSATVAGVVGVPNVVGVRMEMVEENEVLGATGVSRVFVLLGVFVVL